MKNKPITKLVAISFILVVLLPVTSAVIIESTTSNQYDYQNGDLIEIILDTNAQGLEITADFSTVDINYNQQMVIVEEEDTVYKIYYPITFSNDRGDNDYNILITAYDPVTSTTSSVSYIIKLANQGKRQEDSQTLIIKVTEETKVTVQNGYIQICDSQGCETITKKEYDASRNIIINDGSVTLSNLTYNQLKTEISDETRTAMKAELVEYLTQIREIKRQLDQGLYDLKEIILDQKNNTAIHEAEAQRILNQGRTNNIIAMLIVMIIVVMFSYTLYLRTETTWFR